MALETKNLTVKRKATMGAHKSYGFYERFVKRPQDFLCAALAIIILSPVFLCIAILIRIKLGSPIFFKQKRPGYKGQIFEMFKFRTMLAPQTRDGRKITDAERCECIEKGIDILSDEERLPQIGRLLRSTSLDELPELWNILRGDMSFVGPRPLASIYLPYYTSEEMRRHDVRPGLTGLAQVHGRNSASWKERFKYDLYYVDHCSFFLDLKIIFLTIAVVLKQSDIGQGVERPLAFNIERKNEWDNEDKPNEHSK